MNIIEQIEAEHAAKLPGAKMPAFQPGDTVIVNVKVAEGERTRIQAYEGVCIARSGHGLNENFTVRKISYGWAVGRIAPAQAGVRVGKLAQSYSASSYELDSRQNSYNHTGELNYGAMLSMGSS